MASGWQKSIRARKRAQQSRPQEWAGYRRHSVARSTGALIVLVDGYAQGLSSPPDPDDEYAHGRAEGRWFLMCDDHNTLLSDHVQADLIPHMSAPEGWCEDCYKILNPEVADDAEAG